MYYQYPLETVARRRRADSQLEFARQAKVALDDTDELLSRPVAEGLALYAANEDALEEPVRVLRDIYGDFVQLAPPKVRVIPGDPAQEPIMNVRVVARTEHSARIVAELRHRDTRILEECTRGRTFVLRAEGPLARLLGLRDALRRITDGAADHAARLVRYDPIREDSDPQGAA
jgi:hypothetical protein